MLFPWRSSATLWEEQGKKRLAGNGLFSVSAAAFAFAALTFLPFPLAQIRIRVE